MKKIHVVALIASLLPQAAAIYTGLTHLQLESWEIAIATAVVIISEILVALGIKADGIKKVAEEITDKVEDAKLKEPITSEQVTNGFTKKEVN